MEGQMSRSLIVLMIAVVTCVSATTANAQGIANSFAELRLLVRAGDQVTVRDDAGAETAGRILNLSPSSLAILVDGERRDLKEADVSTILQRKQDPLRNGAFWGFGTATGLFAITVANADCNGCGGVAVAAGLIYGGLGAAIGVGLDAMIVGPRTVYEKAPGAARLRLSPIVGDHRQGVALQVDF
jgi:hypothetical protein